MSGVQGEPQGDTQERFLGPQLISYVSDVLLDSNLFSRMAQQDVCSVHTRRVFAPYVDK